MSGKSGPCISSTFNAPAFIDHPRDAGHVATSLKLRLCDTKAAEEAQMPLASFAELNIDFTKLSLKWIRGGKKCWVYPESATLFRKKWVLQPVVNCRWRLPLARQKILGN